MSSDATTAFNIQVGGDLTWNVEPLLHEIRHALQELAETGKTGIIDLRSIPLAPGEEDKIVATLSETRYAGVWLVTHYNDEQEIIGRFIEITAMPEILRSQAADIHQACVLLDHYLQRTGQDSTTPEEIQS